LAGLHKTTVAGFTGYLVGNEGFRTKEDALKRIRGILYAYEPGQTVSEDDAQFLLALLQMHQRASDKIGCGVAAFEVQLNPRIPKLRHFVIIRMDGSETDFSFIKCLKLPSPKNIFRRTCRLAIAEQIIEFKASYYSQHQNDLGQIRCPLTGEWIIRTQAHVDHLPPLTFDTLVEDFITSRALNIDTVQITESEQGDIGTIFADSALAADWMAYHKEHACLRVVSAFANLSVVTREHHHALRQMTLLGD
jgi:hypothetical protein